ncbi:MAG: alanine racemase [Candidatus Zixiibacteriota bacterium]
MVRTINDIDTPAILIEKSIMENNISNMQRIAANNGVNLRVHIKTHKIPELAKMQLKAGAVGIAVAKLGEAEIMVEAGVKDIQIANIITGPIKIKRLLRLHRKCFLQVGVDSEYNVRELATAFEKSRRTLDVLIIINTGLNRCGLDNDRRIIKLADYCRSLKGIRLVGLMAHAGHAYAASTKEQIRKIGRFEGERLVEIASALRNCGHKIEVVSVGSTPTARYCSEVKGVTELRVGNYIFNDVAQVTLQIISDTSCAATILSSIISRPSVGRLIIDAGSKALALDRGAHGSDLISGYGRIVGGGGNIARLSEEHGIIEKPSKKFKVGDRIRIIPNHICTVMNLFDYAYLVDGQKVLKKLEIAARGMVN